MIKINEIMICFSMLMFYSCNGQTNKDCRQEFKAARNLAYNHYDNRASLDSALVLVNKCLPCNEIRREVVELKIRLLISLERYSEAALFVGSTKDSDYPFAFKKNMYAKILIARKYGVEKDTIKRNLMYKEIVGDMELYLKAKDVDDKEFKEIYNYLFELKEYYLNDVQINREVDSLIVVYPDKKSFFDFFRK